MLTMYHRLLIFIQTCNVLDLQFQGQRFDSNALASGDVNGVVSIGTADTARTDYTNRDDVNGCQDMSRDFFKQIKRVAVSPVAFSGVCPCVYVCVCVCLYMCVCVPPCECLICVPHKYDLR